MKYPGSLKEEGDKQPTINMKLSGKNIAIYMADQMGYHTDQSGRVYNPEGEIIQGYNSNGYHHFSVRVKGEKVGIPTHRMIAYQLFGDQAFNEGIVVRHLDNNKQNNAWNNLELGSPRENYMDLPKEIRSERARNAAEARWAA